MLAYFFLMRGLSFLTSTLLACTKGMFTVMINFLQERLQPTRFYLGLTPEQTRKL
jgi:hypothetical protein